MTASSSPPRPIDALISVVCPVFREEATIDEFYRRATAAMEAIEPPVAHELIFVDDGSDDASGDRLRAICSGDSRAKLVALSRNFGHQLAITSGMDHARGNALVTMDTDLQDPPEVIAEMVQQWRDGYDVVYGVRSRREGESRSFLMAAKVFYRMINRLSDTPLPLDTGDFRLVDRDVAQVLTGLREENRYIRGLVAWVGFRQTAVHYVRDARYAGASNYSFARLLRLAFDGVTSFSERPLRLASALGAIITAIALVLGVYIIIAKLVDSGQSIQGYASLMVAILFFGGVQLLSVGLLGEYVGRIYRETKRRPLYVVRERINMDGDEAPR